MVAARTPSNQGGLYVLTQATPGTYLAPTQNTDKAVLGLVSQPHPTQTAVIEQSDDTTPYGGGGYSITDGIHWTWPVTVKVEGIGDATGSPTGDILPLLRACGHDEDAPVVADGIAVRFRPTIAYGIAGSAPQTGTPKVASCTWIDGGAGNPLVYRGLDAVGRLESLTIESGELRAAFEFHALWYRSGGSIDSARVSRSATSLTADAIEFLPRASHPLFSGTGWTLTINGGSTDAAELAAAACIESIEFAPGMSLEPQPCLQEVDGYDPSYSVQAAPSVLTLALTQMAGTTLTSPFSAMLRNLVGTSITLRKAVAYGGVTWAVQIVINNFEVFAVESGDSNGKRIETVTFRGFTLSATSRAWELQLERIEP